MLWLLDKLYTLLWKPKKTRKQAEEMRVAQHNREKIEFWADTYIRLLHIYEDEQIVEELMRAMCKPQDGPCEPTQIVRSEDGIIKVHRPMKSGQELI